MGWLLRGAGRRAAGGGAPARAHVSKAGRTLPGFLGPLQRAPPEPGHGVWPASCRGKGAGLTPPPPTSVPLAPVKCSGSSWHPGGAPEESLPGVGRVSGREGGSGGAREEAGAPATGPQGPHPDGSGLRERAAPGLRLSVRGCGVIPGDWPAPRALGPPPLRPGSPPGSRGGRAAGLRCVPAPATSESAQALARRASGTCQGCPRGCPQPQRTPDLILLGCEWMWGSNFTPPQDSRAVVG